MAQKFNKGQMDESMDRLTKQTNGWIYEQNLKKCVIASKKKLLKIYPTITINMRNKNQRK